MTRKKIATLDTLKASSAELPDLTANQMEFVRGLLDGMTATDAYRHAYNCKDMVPNSIWYAASRLRSDTKVAQWLSAARQAYLGTAVVTKDSHLRELERLREIAVDTGNVGASILAEQIRGKVAGHHVERYEDVTPPDPIATLEFIKRLNPQLAIDLARQYGVKLIEMADQHQEHEGNAVDKIPS